MCYKKTIEKNAQPTVWDKTFGNHVYDEGLVKRHFKKMNK